MERKRTGPERGAFVGLIEAEEKRKATKVNARKIRLYPRKRATAPARGRTGAFLEERHPLPPKPPEMPWRDYLIMLLHVAAELEHALMVEYLYAAYSLGGRGVPEDLQEDARRWRDKLLIIAKEEMGHLLTVQNVLTLVGGPVSFERSDFPWDTPFYPFPFRLEPASLDSIACYVWAEMPADMKKAKLLKSDSRMKEFFSEDRQKVIAAVQKRVERIGEAHQVGEIYERIIDILKSPKLIPDSDFRPETHAFQASWDDWGRGYKPGHAPPGETQAAPNDPRTKVIVARMSTRTEAIAALSEVAGQGEAPHLRSDYVDEPSHFDRFLEIFQGFERSKWKKLVRDVPVNPTTLEDRIAGKSRTPIENENSRHWAALFNLRYRLLLTYLAHTYRIARISDPNEPNIRGAVMHKAFGEMYNLKSIAGILVRLPLGQESSSKRAGPPFEMPYTLELPLDEVDCWRMYEEMLATSDSLCRILLENSSRSQEVPEAADYLKALRGLDQQTGAWIRKILEGLRTSRRHAR